MKPLTDVLREKALAARDGADDELHPREVLAMAIGFDGRVMLATADGQVGPLQGKAGTLSPKERRAFFRCLAPAELRGTLPPGTVFVRKRIGPRPADVRLVPEAEA